MKKKEDDHRRHSLGEKLVRQKESNIMNNFFEKNLAYEQIMKEKLLA